MGSRIITAQRRLRELGRLRAGLTATNSNGKSYPTSSKTWILTSPNRGYVEAAAALWGGQVEQWQPQGKGVQEWRVITQASVIDAVLPPGDPISQAQELWGGGGCQRRCDGETEQLSQKPCLCRAQFGEDFHTVPLLGPDRKPQRCSMVTRLSVILPDMPDIGMYRVETHGYWPGTHITGYVEFLKGVVGAGAMIPVTLGIEPRTKVRDGQTSRYIEIVVGLKGSRSFGEIVAAPQSLAIGGSSDTRTIEAGEQRQAIGSRPAQPAEDRPALGAAPAEPQPVARPSRQWHAEIKAATTIEDVRRLWREAVASGEMDDVLRRWLEQRAAQLDAEHAPPVPVDEPATMEPSDPDTSDETVDLGVWQTAMDNCTTVEDLRQVYDDMENDPWAKGNKVLRAYFWKRKKEIEQVGKAQPAQAGPEPDRQATWMAVLALAGERGWSTTDVSQAFREQVGVDVSNADGRQIAAFLDYLRSEAVPA